MEPWKKLREEPLYAGWMKLVRRVYRRPDGGESSFEVLAEDTVACVLALTPDHQVICARQFRPGVERVVLELPGGHVDAGETPLAAAKRELLEETGYEGETTFVTASFVGAASTRLKHNFVAVNCRRVKAPQDAPREPIEVVLLSLDDFKAHLRTGQLTDVSTGYLGLDFLKLL